jgi:hypothetical protein
MSKEGATMEQELKKKEDKRRFFRSQQDDMDMTKPDFIKKMLEEAKTVGVEATEQEAEDLYMGRTTSLVPDSRLEPDPVPASEAEVTPKEEVTPAPAAKPEAAKPPEKKKARVEEGKRRRKRL